MNERTGIGLSFNPATATWQSTVRFLESGIPLCLSTRPYPRLPQRRAMSKSGCCLSSRLRASAKPTTATCPGPQLFRDLVPLPGLQMTTLVSCKSSPLPLYHRFPPPRPRIGTRPTRCDGTNFRPFCNHCHVNHASPGTAKPTRSCRS